MSETVRGARRWMLLASVQIGNLIAAVDATIVNIALPSLAAGLGISAAESAWVATSYFIVNIVFLPICGRLADRHGRRPFMIGGFAVFGVAAFLSAFAPTFETLLAARAVQAAGAASLIANGSAVSAAAFVGRLRGVALGLNSTVIGLGYSLGFVLGGVIVDLLDWRAVFWVSVPFAAAALALSVASLPRGRPEPDAGFAAANMAALVAAIAGTIYGLRALGDADGRLFAAAALAAGLAALALFVRLEARSARPVLPAAIIRSPNFAFANLTVLVFSTLLASVGFLLPFHLRTIVELDGAAAGLALAPYSVVVSLAAPLAGWLAVRHDGFLLAGLGLGLAAAVALVYATALGQPGGGLHAVALGQAALGLAAGLFYAPNRLMLFGSMESSGFGAANAALQIVNAAAFALGPTGAALALIGFGATGARPAPEPFLDALSATFAVIAAASAAASVWALRRMRRAPARRQETAR